MYVWCIAAFFPCSAKFAACSLSERKLRNPPAAHNAKFNSVHLFSAFLFMQVFCFLTSYARSIQSAMTKVNTFYVSFLFFYCIFYCAKNAGQETLPCRMGKCIFLLHFKKVSVIITIGNHCGTLFITGRTALFTLTIMHGARPNPCAVQSYKSAVRRRKSFIDFTGFSPHAGRKAAVN